MPRFRRAAPLLLWPAILTAGAFERGVDAFQKSNYGAAAREFEQAVREKPGNAQYQKMLGRAYMGQSMNWKARGPLQTACDVNPREPEACYYLGRANYILSRFDAALAAFQTA